MSRIKVTYVAMDVDGYKPIMTAETFDDLRKGLDDYYAVDRGAAKCLGFEPYITKYPDDYEGCYKYTYKAFRKMDSDELADNIDTIRVYCVDFWPVTKEEI